MKITLAERGGLAGIALPPRVLDAATLNESDARELRVLVAAAEASKPGSGGPAFDGAGYTITVEDGGQPVTIKQSDAAMTEAFGRLLSWIKRRM